MRLQVETTAGIEVGQWVRVFALERYQGPRRRELLADGVKPALFRPTPLATAGGGNSTGTAAANTTTTPQSPPPAGANATATAAQSPPPSGPHFLPLTPTLLRQSESARLMDQDEATEGTPGVNAAASKGSLDAYLYGELDGAASGKSEWLARAAHAVPP